MVWGQHSRKFRSRAPKLSIITDPTGQFNYEGIQFLFFFRKVIALKYEYYLKTNI